MMYNMKIKNNFFLWPFSDIKSSNRNPMDDFENFFDCILYLSENAATPGGRWAQFQYWSLLFYTHFFLFFFSHIFTFQWRRKKYICLGKPQSIYTFSLFHVIQNSKMELIYLWAETFLFLLFFKWWKTVLMT